MGWPKGRARKPRGSVGISVDGGPSVTVDVERGDNITVGTDDNFNGGPEFVDPASLAGDADTGHYAGGSAAPDGEGKRRGRPRGNSKKAKSKNSVDASIIETLLYTTHNMLSTLTNIEELSMEESEAKTLALAMKKVADHYEALPGMSEKTAAWANLTLALGMAYGPRIMAYRMRMMNEARATGSTQVVGI